MKRFLSILLVTTLLLTYFVPFAASANGNSKQYSFINVNGETVYYYFDEAGETYIMENGEKEYIAVPVSVGKVTDEAMLAELRASFKSDIINNSINTAPYVEPLELEGSLYQKNMVFSNADTTDVLEVKDHTFLLKCSKLNPTGSDRGFSYYVYSSIDGYDWSYTVYVNKSLLVFTRHRLADTGGPYIKIYMWSYYGTVKSCLLSVK